MCIKIKIYHPYPIMVTYHGQLGISPMYHLNFLYARASWIFCCAIFLYCLLLQWIWHGNLSWIVQIIIQIKILENKSKLFHNIVHMSNSIDWEYDCSILIYSILLSNRFFHVQSTQTYRSDCFLSTSPNGVKWDCFKLSRISTILIQTQTILLFRPWVGLRYTWMRGGYAQ